MNYTQEKLYQAMQALVGAGSVQERLASAAFYLVRLKLRHAFPDHVDLQGKFDGVMSRLTSVPAVGAEGTIDSSTRALSDEDGAQIADDIFGLFLSATQLADTPVGGVDGEDTSLGGQRNNEEG